MPLSLLKLSILFLTVQTVLLASDINLASTVNTITPHIETVTKDIAITIKHIRIPTSTLIITSILPKDRQKSKKEFLQIDQFFSAILLKTKISSYLNFKISLKLALKFIA
jgi:hypothetical protein